MTENFRKWLRIITENVLLIYVFLISENILNCHKFYSIFHSKQLHILYSYPNYSLGNNIKRNISVLAFTYVFQMTTVKYSCCWDENGNESSSRTKTAHYLQNHIHIGISEDWFQQHQWTVNYTVVLQPRLIKLCNADEEKHEIMLQMGYTQIPTACKLLIRKEFEIGFHNWNLMMTANNYTGFEEVNLREPWCEISTLYTYFDNNWLFSTFENCTIKHTETRFHLISSCKD